MSFAEAVAELRAKFRKAEMSPSATRGACVDRAAGLDFTRRKGGVYEARDADGTEVLVYYNDTANLICCTEIAPDDDGEEG